MTAVLYYYPDPEGSVEVVDLGELLSDLQIETVPDAAATVSLSGAQTTVSLGSALRVRVVLERFTSATLARKLYSLQAHLQRGGFVAVAETAASVWAGYARAVRQPRGDLYLLTDGNVFQPLSATGTLTSADQVRIQSPPPESSREWCEVSAVTTVGTGVRITLDSPGLLYTHRSSPLLVCHSRFYPLLRLGPEQLGSTILTHDRRITYTLDMTLTEDPAALALFAGWVGNLSSSTAPVYGGSASGSMDKAIARVMQGGIHYAVQAPAYSFVRYPK